MPKERRPFRFPIYFRPLFGTGMRSVRGYAVPVILLFALSLAVTVNAAETREIELTDGSVITGEVVSMSGGVYIVRSATLGTLRIEASNIRVIRTPGSAAGQAKALEDKMLSDSDIMEAVRALQNDPDLQKILQDPEIMKAVQTGDIGTLMRNPEFVKLLNKYSVQDINKKLAR